MSVWATRRKTVYLGGVIICIIVFIGIPLFAKFYTPPTCFDQKQNQGEYGLDCGGPCKKLCSSQFLDPLVVWARPLKVSPGVYNILAYVTNPNLDGFVRNAPYVFKLYDREGILISEKKGTTFILPHSVVPVFEGGVTSGQRVPALVTFEFYQPIAWDRVNYGDQGIIINQKTLTEDTPTPRLDATIQNRTTRSIGTIEVTAIVYDTNDNAMAVSKTYIDSLADNQSAPVTFTWRERFPKKSSRVEIIPLVRP